MRKPAFAAQTKTAGSFDPAVSRLTTTKLSSENYPAFFSGAPAAFFFSIARFNSSARGGGVQNYVHQGRGGRRGGEPRGVKVLGALFSLAPFAGRGRMAKQSG